MPHVVIQELAGTDPPNDESVCWCGNPATIPVMWRGCRYCGGAECGDAPGVDWICSACFDPDGDSA